VSNTETLSALLPELHNRAVTGLTRILKLYCGIRVAPSVLALSERVSAREGPAGLRTGYRVISAFVRREMIEQTK
jgi:hypothetical protein